MILSKLPPYRQLHHALGALRASNRAASTRKYGSYGSSHVKYPESVFKISEEVAEAVHSGKPVVALETTIYTHGFPYPDNVSLATHLESVVRIHGGIPATIGVLHGVARVGLSQSELVELASAAGKKEAMKVSRRDLPFITGLGLSGKKLNGGTTISGTMILAQMAGIEVFGTGGLGGVHRGGHETMDISADLTELGRTPVSVISSGPKAFLDLPRTLEYLETQGVMVGTFADGRTNEIELPAFYTRESGIRSPFVVENEKEAAAIIYARRLLDIQSGIFLANPIPSDFSIPKAEIDIAIEEAISDAERQGIRGHANTPFILARIKDLTKGSSIPANRALIESNVERAAKVAVELMKLTAMNYAGVGKESIKPSPSNSSFLVPILPTLAAPAPPTPEIPQPVAILVAGSVAIDLSCDHIANTSTAPILHTSNPAVISQSIGGVGHNVATAAHLASLPGSVRLCSLVADDLAGKAILADMTERGMDISGIKILPSDTPSSVSTGATSESEIAPTNRTAQYIAVNTSSKSLHLGISDMSILDTSTNRPFRETWAQILSYSAPKWLVLDANWSPDVLSSWIYAARVLNSGSKIAFEPVSVAKSARLFPPITPPTYNYKEKSPDLFPLIDLLTPNTHELLSLHATAKTHGYLDLPTWWSTIDSYGIPSSGARDKFQFLLGAELTDQGIPQMMVQLLPFCPAIVTKLGSEGVILAKVLRPDSPELFNAGEARYVISRGDGAEIGGVYMRHFPAPRIEKEEIVSVNGAGDTFLGVLVAGLARGVILDGELVDVAQEGAIMTLKSREAVGKELGWCSGVLEGLVKPQK